MCCILSISVISAVTNARPGTRRVIRMTGRVYLSDDSRSGYHTVIL